MDKPLKLLKFGAHDFASALSSMEDTKILVRQALRLHGYDIELGFYPGKRLITELNGGRLDGDLFRTVNLSRGFDNIVRIEEPLTNHCALFYQLEGRPIDLSNPTLSARFGMGHGTPAIQTSVASAYPRAGLEFFKKLSHGIDMLEHERIDLLVVISGQEPLMHRMSRKKVVLAGGAPLSPIYIHLHARHRQLALDLAPTLKRLKAHSKLTICDQEILDRRLSRDIRPSNTTKIQAAIPSSKPTSPEALSQDSNH